MCLTVFAAENPEPKVAEEDIVGYKVLYRYPDTGKEPKDDTFYTPYRHCDVLLNKRYTIDKKDEEVVGDYGYGKGNNDRSDENGKRLRCYTLGGGIFHIYKNKDDALESAVEMQMKEIKDKTEANNSKTFFSIYDIAMTEIQASVKLVYPIYEYVVVRAVIPKGAKYYEGEFDSTFFSIGPVSYGTKEVIYESDDCIFAKDIINDNKQETEEKKGYAPYDCKINVYNKRL